MGRSLEPRLIARFGAIARARSNHLLIVSSKQDTACDCISFSRNRATVIVGTYDSSYRKKSAYASISDSCKSAIDGAEDDAAAPATGIVNAPLCAASHALIGASLKLTPLAFLIAVHIAQEAIDGFAASCSNRKSFIVSKDWLRYDSRVVIESCPHSFSATSDVHRVFQSFQELCIASSGV